MTHYAITKNQFLKNLEKALKKLICNRLYENENEAEKQVLGMNVAEFIRENASNYSLEELKETFVSAEASIGLFLNTRTPRCSAKVPMGNRENRVVYVNSLVRKNPGSHLTEAGTDYNPLNPAEPSCTRPAGVFLPGRIPL